MKTTTQIKLMMVVWGALLIVLGLIIWHIWPQPHTCPLPSLMELQEIVGAKVDGKICKLWNVPGHSETGEKWDAYMCERYAAEAMEPYVEDDGYLHAEW